MVTAYSFLVAHPRPGHDLSMSMSYSVMKEWMQKMGGRIDRYGGKNGGVIKFSEGKLIKELGGGKIESIELYSERILEKGEVRETLNCECSAVLAKDVGLVLSVSSGRSNISNLVNSFFEYSEWCASFDYAYAYSENHAYGFGYAQGIHTVDESHPLTWSGGDEVIMWLKMQWAGKQDFYIRDVYAVNLFSPRKLGALPSNKLHQLKSAMVRYGECSVKEGFTVWILNESEREMARKELAEVELLAACMA